MKIIKVSALWCPSCLIMNDIIDEVVNEKSMELIKYDYDYDAEIVNRYNVGNILPVLILINDKNEEIKRIVGEHSKKEIIEFMEG